MATGVFLFGGFSGVESLDEFDLRDWKANPTILDGGGPVVETAEGTLLDGFVVENGDSTILFVGGGVHVPANGRIHNCTIQKNEYGGVTCDDAHIEMRWCEVSKNVGGGIVLNDAKAMIEGCRIVGNTALSGGGLDICDSTLEMRNCQITDNSAFHIPRAVGGGINTDDSVLYLDGCLILNNIAQAGSQFLATSYGGGIYSLAEDRITLTNCVLEGNRSLHGSVVSLGPDSQLELIN
ncbi:MAG: right-handed parallel beta-helix repeat-containing protein [Candidatus Omnitrophica bacterium]|nr:right-handed parallel beta-helix repeat-containing protein [Candidatus Omnitrophota bacterium]